MGCVYKVTNLVNGKLFIGKTINTLRHRRLEHLLLSKNGSNTILHRAIRKYNENNFNWEYA